jgi:hypothetical protein
MDLLCVHRVSDSPVIVVWQSSMFMVCGVLVVLGCGKVVGYLLLRVVLVLVLVLVGKITYPVVSGWLDVA